MQYIKYRPKCYDDENLVIKSLDELSVHVQNSLACMYTTCLKRYKNRSIDATTFDKMVHFKCIFRIALLLETQMAVLEMRQWKKCRDNILRDCMVGVQSLNCEQRLICSNCRKRR